LYNNCIEIKNKKISFFKDDGLGIKYQINNNDVNNKLKTFNIINSQNNTIINSNTYKYHSFFSSNFANKDLKEKMSLLLENKKYIEFFNNLNLIYQNDKNDAFNMINNLIIKINNVNITLNSNEKEIFLKRILPMLLSVNNEKFIIINNYPELKTYIKNNNFLITKIGNILNYSNPTTIVNTIIN